MENEGVTNSVIRFINKNGELTPQYLSDMKDKISVLRDLREKIDSALDRLKINIIKICYTVKIKIYYGVFMQFIFSNMKNIIL